MRPKAVWMHAAEGCVHAYGPWLCGCMRPKSVWMHSAASVRVERLKRQAQSATAHDTSQLTIANSLTPQPRHLSPLQVPTTAPPRLASGERDRTQAGDDGADTLVVEGLEGGAGRGGGVHKQVSRHRKRGRGRRGEAGGRGVTSGSRGTRGGAARCRRSGRGRGVGGDTRQTSRGAAR